MMIPYRYLEKYDVDTFSAAQDLNLKKARPVKKNIWRPEKGRGFPSRRFVLQWYQQNPTHRKAGVPMKKRFVLALLLSLCLLAGCGTQPQQPQAPEPPAVSQPQQPESAPSEAPEEPEESARPLLRVAFAEGDLAQTACYTLEESEYTEYLAFWAGEPVTDFHLQAMQLAESGYIPDALLYAQDEVIPEEPVVAGVVFYGDMTGYGICFFDAAGNPHQYAVTLSGMDGSPELREMSLPY